MDQLFSARETAHPQRKTSLVRLIAGLILCAGSLLGLFAKILFGEWFSMIGIMYGLILILESLFLDINQDITTRENGRENRRFQMLHHQNAMNYWLEIAASSSSADNHASIVSAWHGLFMAYLLGNIAMQIIYALRFGAFVDPFSLINVIASLAFGIVVGLGFSKLLRNPKVILALFVTSLVAGVILGVFL